MIRVIRDGLARLLGLIRLDIDGARADTGKRGDEDE
jgi:hypothetical protein